MLPKKRKEWTPLSDSSLNIIVAVVISLLVNVVSSITWESVWKLQIMQILLILLLLIASVLVGLYAKAKATAIKEYQNKIEEEELWGFQNTSKRFSNRKEIYDKLRPSAQRMILFCVGCLVIAVVLLGLLAYARKHSVQDGLQLGQQIGATAGNIDSYLKTLPLEEDGHSGLHQEVEGRNELIDIACSDRLRSSVPPDTEHSGRASSPVETAPQASSTIQKELIRLETMRK